MRRRNSTGSCEGRGTLPISGRDAIMQPKMGVGWHAERLPSKGITQICKLLTASRTDVERLFPRLLLGSSPCQPTPRAKLRLARNIIPAQDGDAVAG